mgnify:CR=1 FL=1|jgi:hypothetical protein
MEGYATRIIEASKELSKKESVMLKDMSDCIKLDEVLKDGAITFKPEYYAVVGIHNEKSDNKDYQVYVVVDETGNKYSTSSESFFTSFKDIFSDMCETDEEWALKVYKLDSKNYNGRQFITCSII